MASDGRPLVQLRGVTKRYSNGTVAVSGVDLDLRAGEFVTLLGPSGCGKSTVLRMIAGLGEVSSGAIDWPSVQHDWRGQPARDLGFVFQDPTLMPWATALHNVTLPLKLKKMPSREAAERARSALAAVGLASFVDAYPRELSGGIMGLAGRGLIKPGAPADLVLLSARFMSEMLSRSQADRIVLRTGKPIDTSLSDYRRLDQVVGING